MTQLTDPIEVACVQCGAAIYYDGCKDLAYTCEGDYQGTQTDAGPTCRQCKPQDRPPLFHAFTWQGVKYLAFDNRNNRGTVSIVDDAGNNYGAWYGADDFRKHYRGYTPLPVGRVAYLELIRER